MEKEQITPTEDLMNRIKSLKEHMQARKDIMETGTARVLSIEEAVQIMKEKIAAGEENLKRQQVELALSVKMKTMGNVVSDKGISTLANTIRLAAEVSLYGAEYADQIGTMTVTPEEICNYPTR